MTFVDAFIALSDRFLYTRTFELVVAPAIADLQHDETTGGRGRSLRGRAAVAWGFAWGLYEDAITPAGLLTFATLALLPAGYYTMLMLTVAPEVGASSRLTLAAIIGVLSLGPAIACYWPERPARHLPTDNR
jgi:hypothetical protein